MSKAGDIRCFILVLALGSSSACAANTSSSPDTAVKKTKSTVTSDPKDLKELTPTLSEKPSNPLTFRVGIPGWISAISGSVGVRGRVSNAAYVSFGDLFKKMDYAVPGSIEVGYGKWGVLLDGQYAKLSDTLNTRDILFSSAKVQFEQAFAELNLSYKVVDTANFSLAPFVGTRFEYVRVSGQASTTGIVTGTPRNFDESKETEWADPILGFQTQYQVFKPVALVAKADVGGFGAASHLTYQFFAGGQAQLTRCLYVNAGYRYLQTDYSSNGFTWNIAYSGPQMTFGVNF